MAAGFACCLIAASLAPTEARARAPRIDLPPLQLRVAIETLSRRAGVSIGMEGALPPLTTRQVRHAGSVAAALEQMLRGSGIRAVRVSEGAWRLVAQPRPLPRPHAAPPPMGENDAIIVTAAKRPEVLRKLPRVVAVVPLDPLASAAPDSGSILIARGSEGLTLTNFGPGRNRMFLRGVADSPFDGSSQSTVAILVDDSRVTFFAPDPDLRLIDVTRVELLEGPQGSLYGTGALGGIYHVVTARADPDALSGTVSAEAVASDHGGLGAQGSGVLNLPVTGSSALRLVGYGGEQPGWIDTGARRDSNRTGIKGGRADFGLETGGWRIDLTGLFQRIDTADSQYSYAPGALSRPAQLPEPHDNDFNQAGVHATGRIGTVDAVLVSSWSWHEVKDSFDATSGAGGFGLADPQLFQDFRHYRVWDSEARFSGTLGAIRWLGGVDYLAASEDETRTLTAPAALFQIDDSRRRSHDTGLYGDVTLPLLARLSLELGGRLYHDQLDASRLGGATLTAEVVTTTGISPTAALVWQPGAGRLGWLRYGTATREGGLDYESDGRVHPFAGDEVRTLEAGWRQATGGHGSLDANGFVTWWDDMQADMLLANGLIETRNAGTARIIGAQASLTRGFGADWQLTLGASAQSALLVTNRLGIALDDRRLPVIPEYTLRARIERDFTLGRHRATATLALRYLGPARLSFDPRLDRPMGNLLDSELSASLALGRSTLSLRIDNLFDAASNSFAFGNPFRAALPQFTPQPPLTATVAVVRPF
ncbi:MAG: TonB-dependent receptor [Sphingomonadales bacterium]|nr:TonB-dependent receptor [Sphingomonadales bacterium]